MKKIFAFVILSAVFIANAAFAIPYMREAGVKPLIVNGVCRAWVYYGQSSILNRIDIFYDAGVADYGAAETSGSIAWAFDQGAKVINVSSGIYPLTTTMMIPSYTKLTLSHDATIKLTASANTNMLRNANAGSAQKTVTSLVSADGITCTATANSHGYEVNDFVFIIGAEQDDYNGVWKITAKDTNTFSFKIAEAAPAETLTSPATGTIYAYKGDGEIEVSGGTWDGDNANQSGDTYAGFNFFFRRLGVTKLHGIRMVNAEVKAMQLENMYESTIENIDVSGTRGGVQLVMSGKGNNFNNISGKTSDDIVCICQGDYAQYRESGYKIGSIDRNIISNINAQASLSIVKIVPQSGYLFGSLMVKNIAGKYASQSGMISVVTDTDVGSRGTIANLLISGVQNSQAGTYPIIQLGSNITSAVINDVQAIIGNSAGTSNGILVPENNTITDLIATNLAITGGGSNAQGLLINGAISNLVVNNIVGKSLANILLIGAGSTNINASINNLYGHTCGELIQLNATGATLKISNVSHDNFQNIGLLYLHGGTATVYGSNISISKDYQIYRDASESFVLYGETLGASAAAVALSAGSIFYNNDSTTGGSLTVGVVYCDGTSFFNLENPAHTWTP